MAFWGIQVKPGRPITHSADKSGGRLRISQATLGIGEATKTTVVQCNVGKRSPVLLCALLPNKIESCHMDLEFEESNDVIFSVIGPRSVYLTGYYINQSRHSDPNSDSESYGVDIQNSQTDGSSYCSEEDAYEGSFIDDDELQVSPPSPASSNKEMDEASPEKDKTNGRKGRRKLKKKYQMIESDSENSSHESEDDNAFLFTLFKKRNAEKKILTESPGKVSPSTVGVGDNVKENSTCVSKLQEKKVFQDVNGSPENGTDDKLNDIRNILPEEKTIAKITINTDNVPTDGKGHENIAETKMINNDLLTNNARNQIQSPDIAMSKKKRKKQSGKEKTIDKNHILFEEDKEHELGVTVNRKSKKRRKEVTSSEVPSTSQEIKHDHSQLNADDSLMDLTANGEYQDLKIVDDGLLSINSIPEKKTKKKKKTQGKGDSSIPNVTDNQETKFTEISDQTIKTTTNQEWTLSNGLIIQVLDNGQADGKLAACGKKVKVYFTAMVKESGRIFDSNVGKKASKFQLGNEGFIDGWYAGIDGMHVGEKRRVTVPPSMSYGAGENAPPNSWLVYDVELAHVYK